MYKGYTFSCHNRYKTTLSWVCSRRVAKGCKAKLVTTVNGIFVKSEGEHCHVAPVLVEVKGSVVCLDLS